MIRLLGVVGARPNFMKIAPVMDELKRFPEIELCLVHSGQHYDDLLSGSFFADLALPKPDVNLAAHPAPIIHPTTDSPSTNGPMRRADVAPAV